VAPLTGVPDAVCTFPYTMASTVWTVESVVPQAPTVRARRVAVIRPRRMLRSSSRRKESEYMGCFRVSGGGMNWLSVAIKDRSYLVKFRHIQDPLRCC
jgi:hypothetical protein